MLVPFICLPVLFICLPGWLLVVGLVAGLSPTSFNLFPTQPGRHMKRSGIPFVSHFFSFVSQAGCLWSGSRPACLPPPFIYLPVLFICLPGWVLVVGFLVSHFLSVLSQARCLWSGSRRLVSHFLECVSHFFSFASQAGCLWPGSCLRGPSLLVPCRISIDLFPRSVTAAVRPFPLAM